jgi:hypothetical protein
MKVFTIFLFGCMLALNIQAQNNAGFQIGLTNAQTIHYTPDQTLLGVATANQIRFYTAGTQTLVNTIKPSIYRIQAFSFFEQDPELVVVAVSTELLVYRMTTNQIVYRYVTDESILAVEWMGDLKVAMATAKGISVYDFGAKQLIFTRAEHTKPIRSLSISRLTGLIVSGGGDGFVVVYDQDGKVQSKKKFHESWVRSVSISPDGKWIASGDEKGQIMLSNTDGNLVQTFTDASGWVRALQFSGDNKYLAAGDEKGNCFIYWVERRTLSKRFNARQPIPEIRFKPDGKELVMIEEIKGIIGWDVSFLNIAPVFKFRDQADHTPPQIFIANPPNIQGDRIRFSGDMIDLRGVVVDESGVRNLRINSADVPLRDNGNFVMYLPLTMGDNPVTIEARDINDNIAVKKFIIARKDLGGEVYDHTKARNFLFVVGVNDYEYWPKLNNAVKDANDVASTLLGMYTFDFADVVVLKNEQATRNNIYKSLRSLIEQVTPQDNLVIYYSGHGYFDELLNEGYWIPVDARLNANGEYLSNSDLLKIIGSINSQHTFLVADACFSGALFSEPRRGYAENVERFRSRWGLASGRLEVVSDGQVGKNSPFTSVFLSYLRTTDKEKFTVSELVQHVKVKVSEEADQTPMGSPLKVAGDEGGEYVFYRKR